MIRKYVLLASAFAVITHKNRWQSSSFDVWKLLSARVKSKEMAKPFVWTKDSSFLCGKLLNKWAIQLNGFVIRFGFVGVRGCFVISVVACISCFSPCSQESELYYILLPVQEEQKAMIDWCTKDTKLRLHCEHTHTRSNHRCICVWERESVHKRVCVFVRLQFP